MLVAEVPTCQVWILALCVSFQRICMVEVDYHIIWFFPISGLHDIHSGMLETPLVSYSTHRPPCFLVEHAWSCCTKHNLPGSPHMDSITIQVHASLHSQPHVFGLVPGTILTTYGYTSYIMHDTPSPLVSVMSNKAQTGYVIEETG
jgi:hypothetical protein